MKALITGGRGYIGRNLEHLLKSLNIPTVVFDMDEGRDILDDRALSLPMRKVDVCFHLAAFGNISECEKAPAKATETNVWGTFKVASIAHMYGVKVIFASSFAVTHPENRFTVYGLSKALGEKLVLYYGGTVCSISNVYGGMDFTDLKDSVIARLMTGRYEDRGHGSETRDFIHVEDVCKKLVRACEVGHGPIDICSGRLTRIDELVEMSKDPSFPNNLRALDPFAY